MNRKALLITAASLLASPALAQSVFLNDATLVAPNGQESQVDIAIEDGTIVALASEVTPDAAASVIENAWVSPGLVASYSTLGLVDIGAESSTNDTSANTDLASASIKASDSFNPRMVHIGNARRRGIMYAAVVPSPAGDTIFGGTGLTASLDGSDGSVLNDIAMVHIALGEAGARRAGGSRGAAMAQLRGALDDARRGFQTQDEGDVLRRRDARALRPVLSGAVPLMISASRASDLSRIIDLKTDYPNLDIIVVGAEEAHLVADDLAEAGIKIIIDPHENLPDTFDSVNASLDNVVAVNAAGVDYAISSLSSLGVVKAGALVQNAGNAVGNGLARDAAFRAITSTPAEWFGIEMDDVSQGDRATLIVWDGDPLEVMSAPIAMYQDGNEISLNSRMTALRDRYNPSVESDRPYKYR